MRNRGSPRLQQEQCREVPTYAYDVVIIILVFVQQLMCPVIHAGTRCHSDRRAWRPSPYGWSPVQGQVDGLETSLKANDLTAKAKD